MGPPVRAIVILPEHIFVRGIKFVAFLSTLPAVPKVLPNEFLLVGVTLVTTFG